MTIAVQTPSRLVTSNQQGTHPRLAAVVKKHLTERYLRPFKSTSSAIFGTIARTIAQQGRQIILDSGCGTAESTRRLAERFPEALVIGIDKSAVRVQKAINRGALPSNMILARMDLVDFWRLARKENRQLARHYIFYPNPWPKKQQLRRRWHGHPAFIDLLALGGRLSLRSNWEVYVQEFAAAVKIVTGRQGKIQVLHCRNPISAFEKKYHASNHILYEFKVDLPSPNGQAHPPNFT